MGGDGGCICESCSLCCLPCFVKSALLLFIVVVVIVVVVSGGCM